MEHSRHHENPFSKRSLLRERARSTLYPVQTEMQTKLSEAFDQLSRDMRAARYVIAQRTELEVAADGSIRSIHEPPPHPAATELARDARQAAAAAKQEASAA